jgi:tetratricopeptide (TPR) repeat protein
MQGRYHFYSGQSPAGWAKAREYLEAAIGRDPQFAVAYDALAELWWYLGFFGVVPARDALAVGVFHAVRAVEIDNTLADAHAMLGQYRKQLDFNWAEVHREMSLALELNPGSPVVRMRRAITELMPVGRLDEAVAELELALEVDPLAPYPGMWLAVMFWLKRDYARGIARARLHVELEPRHFIGHFTLGLICRDAGLYGGAIASHRLAADLAGQAPMMLGWLGLALAESGDREGARALYERLQAMSAKVHVPPTSLAWIHIGLGEIDEFFEWMHRAIDGRDHMIMPIKTYPFFDPIRDDPRYRDLLRKMNLEA